MLLDNARLGIQPDDPRRRWYDQDRGCSRMLLLLGQIKQPVLQEAGCRLLANVAARIRKSIEEKLDFKPDTPGQPLGQGTAYSRRTYDHNPVLKLAHDALYDLPINGLSVLGFTLSDTMEMLVMYSFACERTQEKLDPREILNIIRVGLHEETGESGTPLSEYIGPGLYADLTGIPVSETKES